MISPITAVRGFIATKQNERMQIKYGISFAEYPYSKESAARDTFESNVIWQTPPIGTIMPVTREIGTTYKTIIFNKKTNTTEDATIEFKQRGSNPDSEKYIMYNNKGKEIGSLSVSIHREPMDFKLKPRPNYVRSKMLYDTINGNRLVVETLDGSFSIERTERGHRNEYKYVGTRLMQLAMEISLKEGCEGKVYLDSEHVSYEFYKKCGMKAALEGRESALEREISKNFYFNDQGLKCYNEYGDSIQGGPMYMTEEGIQKFKEMIEKQPILPTGARYLH